MAANYRIILADGTELSDLELNGNNFVSTVPITEDIFENNLSPVTIYENGAATIHYNMELIQISQLNGKYLFILRDISEKEMADIKLRADVDFIAMMSDIEL